MLKQLQYNFHLMTLAILAALSSAQVSAESVSEEKWYQVDMLLVAYTNKANIGNESWPVMLAPADEANQDSDKQIDELNGVIDTNAEFNQAAEDSDTPSVEETYEWIEWWNQPYQGGLEIAENQQLGRPFAINSRTSFDYEASNINRQNGMQVIWKGSWQQDTQSKDLTEIIKVDAQLDQESYIGKHKNLLIDLQGSVQVSRNRYLHLTTDLILKHAELTDYTPTPIEADTDADTETETEINEDNIETEITSPATLMTSDEGVSKVLTPIRTAKIDQKRRMRSGEIHYIDHPLLGVVIKVTPIELEQAVADEN